MGSRAGCAAPDPITRTRRQCTTPEARFAQFSVLAPLGRSQDDQPRRERRRKFCSNWLRRGVKGGEPGRVEVLGSPRRIMGKSGWRVRALWRRKLTVTSASARRAGEARLAALRPYHPPSPSANPVRGGVERGDNHPRRQDPGGGLPGQRNTVRLPGQGQPGLRLSLQRTRGGPEVPRGGGRGKPTRPPPDLSLTVTKSLGTTAEADDEERTAGAGQPKAAAAAST